MKNNSETTNTNQALSSNQQNSNVFLDYLKNRSFGTRDESFPFSKIQNDHFIPALKETLHFFINEPKGQINVDKYSWSCSDDRWALNNLKKRGLLKSNNSKLFKNCFEYKTTKTFEEIFEILKTLSGSKRLKYIRENYKIV